MGHAHMLAVCVLIRNWNSQGLDSSMFAPNFTLLAKSFWECINPFYQIHTQNVSWQDREPYSVWRTLTLTSKVYSHFYWYGKHTHHVILVFTKTFEWINDYGFEMLTDGLCFAVQPSSVISVVNMWGVKLFKFKRIISAKCPAPINMALWSVSCKTG